MSKIRLTSRLQQLAEFVPQGSRIADIGSDHAKIPIYLVENGKVDFAIAGEVVKGPFEIAKMHAAIYPEIQVRLANGLAAIQEQDKIDTAVIAGMGGLLITEILEADKEKTQSLQRLILQPNNEEGAVRRFLEKNDFQIIEERIVEDKGKIYEILLAEKGEMSLSDKEARYGLFLSKSDIFKKKWKLRLSGIEKILSLLPEAEVEQRKKLEIEKAEIEEILNEAG